MTTTTAQWDALAAAFADGSDPVPDNSWTVEDVMAASKRAGRPIELTTARLRVRDALKHGLLTCVREAAGPRAARYVWADGVKPEDVAALFRASE